MLYQIATIFIPNIGNAITRRIIDCFGSIDELFKASKQQLLGVPGLGEKLASQILYNRDKALFRAEKELYFIEKNKIQCLYLEGKDYPKNLKESPYAPVILFCKGDIRLLKCKSLGIVGSRNASNYGKTLCRNIISDFKNANIVTVSGLALGVDAIAHSESLNNNIPTIGVLGHGLDTIYPKTNSQLFNRIADNGLLVTEFPSVTPINKANFPKRNRIIAGLSDAVVVIEAAQRSGALITANLANDYNRDVFACPGRADDLLSVGCNRLIFNHKAHLATSAYDIKYVMGWDMDNTDTLKGKPTDRHDAKVCLISNLNDTESKIYQMISDNKQVHLNAIANALNIDTSDILVTLLNMELNEWIRQLPGDIYVLADQ